MLSEHDHVLERITWFVNGTLDAREHARVMQHLEHCAHCRDELALQQQVRNAIAQPEKIEFAPQTSFNKLWERISAEEHRDQTGHIHQQDSRWRWTGWLQQHWMPLTLSTQTVAILALAAVLLMANNNGAVYHTVTSTNTDNRPIIHVVFDDATRLSDVKDILGKAGLAVATGPSATGVYALTPDSMHVTMDLNATVGVLRADPRIRFAELSHP